MSILKQYRSTILSLVLLLSICFFNSVALGEDTQPAKSWSDYVTLNGDFRLRHDITQLQGDPIQRQRDRIRVRLGVAAQVNDDWKAYIRLTTGENSNTNSANQTLGDSTTGSGEGRKVIWLESAYAEWKPVTNFWFDGGKFPFPILMSDIIFSPDLSFDGGLVKSEFAMNPSMTMFATFGESWLRENPKTHDQGLMVSQLGIRGKKSDWSFLLGFGFYDFTNVKRQPLFFSAFGNSIDTVRNGSLTYVGYANDFNLMNTALKIEWSGLKYPIALMGEHVKNIEVSSQDLAWLLGVQVGKVKQVKDWSVNYSYRVIQKDATIGAFTQPDVGNAGTNVRGHRVDVEYFAMKNLVTALHYYDNTIDPDHAKLYYRRTQAEIVLKF